MEPLFRLALIRPAVQQDPANPSIRIAQNTPFQAALAAAAAGDQPRGALVAVARMFVASDRFIGDPAITPGSAKLAALAAALDALEAKPVLAHADVVDAVNAAFDANPDDLVKGGALDEPLANLRDSILAIKQLQEEHNRPLEALTNQLRDLEVIVRVAADAGFPASGGGLRRYRRRSLQLPTAADLRSILSTRNQEEERRKKLAEAAAERQKQAAAMLDTYRRLHHAIGDLTALDSDHFQTTPQEARDAVAIPEWLTPLAVRERQTAFVDRLADLNLGQVEAALHYGEQPRLDPLLLQDISGDASAATIAKTIVTHNPRPLSGSPAFTPPTLGEVAFRLKATAAEALSDTTKTVLDERKIALAERPLDRIVDILQEELETTSKALDVAYGQSQQYSVKRVGNALVTISTTLPSAWASLSVAGLYQPVPFIPLDQRIPHTRGKVAPAGIADLLVVKQQLIGYEGADIAHIENVLKGERKEREHTRRRETEELTFRETETISSEERELESTDRFEMTRETSATIREDASLKAGLNISGKYGPTVEFSASAEGSMSRSKEEATKSATRFSQDVTQRSATKISERVLERASLRVTTEVIEKDVHELNNVGGVGHISGVYQWVNKVYQAQMFNYGLRTMFDFMVPEPAAYLMEALQSAHASAVNLEKPPTFTLKPNEITETNYHTWVRTYGATDVAPPPEMYKTKSLDFKGGGGDESADYTHSGQIAIDEGYRAVQGSVGAVTNIWSNPKVDVVLGRKAHRFVNDGNWVWVTTLSDERDSVPFSLVTNDVNDVAVAVEVKCQRTDRAMEKWRLETHGKLTTAYKARLSEYEEKLAQLELQAGVAIRGRNPALNLEIMQDELKKNCISILTDQHYDLFDAIDYAWSTALPQIDVFEAAGEGPYVRFFEQAFEWEHMTWVTYPYFWGRKDQWDERLAFEDPDPLFNQFLKAGYCRVSVPARPGFEGAIDHFMTYGELWNGGPLPPISSPLYLPIADEIAERLDRPGDEVPQGDPWLVRLPTTLVHLRADDKLPTWHQDANGNWVEG
ncbi:MAG: hypothetical protein U0031_09410 [Thermomicrobiales bacterium]